MGAVAVAMVMALSPTAAATGAGLVIHAAYHGAVSPSNYIDTSGCGKVKIAKPWNFHLKTGLGGGASTGKALACPKSLNGVGTSGYASSGGSFEVAIPMKIPGTTSSVTVNGAWKAAVTLKATDGYTGTTTPVCNAPVYSYYDYGNYYGWGWTPYSFAFYNDSYGYSSSGGYSYNYSYGNAAIPSPFNLNNTSYEDVYVSYGASSSCYASAGAYMSAYGSLVDETTGSYMSMTGSTMGTFFDVYLSVVNQTSWSCSASTYWNGPYNYSYSSPLTCYSYNTTLTSYIYNFAPTYSVTTGTNNTVTWGGSMTGTGSMWWNDTFMGGHHYTLFFTVSGNAWADDSWKHGSGTFGFNLATLGNGFNLKSITLT